MKIQDQKTNVNPYLEHGYNYVVVLTDNETFNVAMYECDFFKTRKKAENFNAERLHYYGEVMTTRQAVKKYEFFVNE
jgi:hypothetical protein